MKIFTQIQNDKMLFTYSMSEDVGDRYSLHCHNIYEIYYFIEGEADYLVEGHEYHPTPHSLLLISPNVFHGVKVNSTKPYRRYALHFDPEILSLERRHLLLSAFPSIEKYSGKEVFYPDTEHYRIHSFFQSIADCSTLPPNLQINLLPIYMEALLSQIMLMCIANPAAVEHNSSKTVTNIIAHLNKHLTEPISLDQISEIFFISKHHLNKVFRKATGTTVGDYLLYKRIIYAQQLLINGYNAGQAASEAGFGDYSSFYRAYSKFLGHSPLKDRGALFSLPDGR